MHPDVPGIQTAMAAIEAQRAVLGDATTEMALAPLRQALADRGVSPDGTRHRHLAILFVDTVGSTSTGQQLDPEDFHELMDRALRKFTAAVESAQGQVLKYTGDGLLAAFGSTRGSEADAEHAVIAGLSMLDEARTLRMTATNPAARSFEIRVGIHVGMVLFGGGVEGERHVSGTVVNVASRLEHAAPTGGIRISRPTFELVRGLFDVIEDPATDLKGVEGTVPTYQVIRPAAGNRRTPQRGITEVTTPMIARDEPLAALQHAYRTVAGGGGLTAVIVTADAGVGKSRLLHEFTRLLAVESQPPTILSANAGPRSANQAFGLVRDAIANFVGISESDPIERVRRQFTSSLRPLFPADADAGEMLVLGHMIGLDFAQIPQIAGIVKDAEQVRVRGGRALANMLRRMAGGVDRSNPVVLVLDDLHWADDATLDLLSELVIRRSDIPLLLVMAARPELLSDNSSWITSISGDRLGMVRLDPLDEAAAGDLARSMLRHLPSVPVELETVLARANGNPFFMEELIRMMLAEGVLSVLADGTWQVATDRLHSLRVPGTLMALLQVRVDALDLTDRATLQRASVVGYVFWDRAVEALAVDPLGSKSKHPPTHLPSAAIDPLVDRGLVVERSESTFDDAAQFTFRHHLLHQFTYSTLLKRDRQRYHAQAAQWFDAKAEATGTEYPGLTADHFERAGMYVEASHRYARAAEDANARGATRSALTFVRRGLGLVEADDLPTKWALTASLEELMYHMGDRVAQAEAVETLTTLAEALDDSVRRSEASFRHMSVLFAQADLEGTIDAGVGALALAVSAGDERLQARVLGLKSTALGQLGRLDEALFTARQALTTARSAGDRSIESSVLGGLSVALTASGDLVGGRDAALAGLEISRELGDAYGVADGLNVAGYASLGLGNLGAARQQFEASHREATEIGWAFVEAASLKNMALVLLLSGDHAGAQSTGERAVGIALESGSRDIGARALTTIGLAQTDSGDTDRARATLEGARALHIEVGAAHCAVETLAALAALDLACGDLGSAVRGVDEVLAFLAAGNDLDGVNEPFRPRWLCWQILSAAGDPRAHTVLEEAHSMLLDRARRVSDQEARAQFLGEIPYHRDILAAWEACDQLTA